MKFASAAFQRGELRTSAAVTVVQRVIVRLFLAVRRSRHKGARNWTIRYELASCALGAQKYAEDLVRLVSSGVSQVFMEL